MKSTTYFAEITTQKAEKYLREETRIHYLLAHLLASSELRNFLCEFTENCFAIFDQSSHAIYLMWHRLLLFFPEFTSIIPFIIYNSFYCCFLQQDRCHNWKLPGFITSSHILLIFITYEALSFSWRKQEEKSYIHLKASFLYHRKTRF